MLPKFPALTLALLLSATLAACGKSETPANAAATGEMIVKIGSIAPLTGPQAHLGKDNENGARLAIEDANAKGITLAGQKVRFELVSEDDQADPKTATIVAQKLVDDKVNGVIGHLTPAPPSPPHASITTAASHRSRPRPRPSPTLRKISTPPFA